MNVSGFFFINKLLWIRSKNQQKFEESDLYYSVIEKLLELNEKQRNKVLKSYWLILNRDDFYNIFVFQPQSNLNVVETILKNNYYFTNKQLYQFFYCTPNVKHIYGRPLLDALVKSNNYIFPEITVSEALYLINKKQILEDIDFKNKLDFIFSSKILQYKEIRDKLKNDNDYYNIIFSHYLIHGDKSVLSETPIDKISFNVSMTFLEDFFLYLSKDSFTDDFYIIETINNNLYNLITENEGKNPFSVLKKQIFNSKNKHLLPSFFINVNKKIPETSSDSQYLLLAHDNFSSLFLYSKKGREYCLDKETSIFLNELESNSTISHENYLKIIETFNFLDRILKKPTILRDFIYNNVTHINKNIIFLLIYRHDIILTKKQIKELEKYDFISKENNTIDHNIAKFVYSKIINPDYNYMQQHSALRYCFYNDIIKKEEVIDIFLQQKEKYSSTEFLNEVYKEQDDRFSHVIIQGMLLIEKEEIKAKIKINKNTHTHKIKRL